MSAKTRDEVEHLKANWLNDPCWDLAFTEDFESHYIELADYQTKMRAAWAQNNITRLQERAAQLGCSITLVRYFETLEDRIKDLERELEQMGRSFS